MAHNPKLNVYILTLNSKEKDSKTFKDLFKFQYPCNQKTDNEIFKLYYYNFLNKIGKDDFVKNEEIKKVFGVSGNDDITFDFKKQALCRFKWAKYYVCIFHNIN